jgi:hypothetical protein
MKKSELKQLIKEAIVEVASHDIDMALKFIQNELPGLGAKKEDNFIILRSKPDMGQLKALAKITSKRKVGPHPEKPGVISIKF